MEQKRNLGNMIISSFMLLISIIIFFIIIPTQIQNPPQVKSIFLKPTFAPRVFTILLGVLGLILLLKAILKRKVGLFKEEETEEAYGDEKYTFEKEKLAIFVLFICVITVILINYIGIVVSSIFFLVFIMMYFGQKRWLLIILVSVLVPIILFFFFHELANVMLPMGRLFSLEGLI